jgi:hypothetical protein
MIKAFLNSSGFKWFMLAIVALIVAYFVWRKLAAFGEAAGEKAVAVGGAVSDVSRQAATNIGQTAFYDSFQLADLFPTSDAEKRANELFGWTK